MTAQQSGPAFASAMVADMVTARVRRSGSSFYWAMRLMNRRRRLAMYAVYAFCREVDDIADEGGSIEDCSQGLARWRQEIDAVFLGRPTLPLGAALIEPIADYGLEKADFIAVIDGVAMDARREMVRPSMATLEIYCDRVACAVGRLSVRVFGDFTPRCLDVADSLGKALQLTNILRDVGEDAEVGRLYLPDELLTKHGIDGADPRAVLAHPALPLVCRDLAAIAQRHYADARAAMADCSRRAMRPAIVMMAVYHELLERLQRDGWVDPGHRVRMSMSTKMWCALRHIF
jgi:phytoene synthase